MSAAEATRRSHYAPNLYSSLAFVREHERRYLAIWDILGWHWENLLFAAAQAVNEIPGPEHGILNPNFSITDEQREAIFKHLADMRWFGGLQLRPGTYDHLLMTGAKFKAMCDRAVTLVNRLKRADEFVDIYGLFGQRPRTDKSDGTVAEIYASLTDNVKAHPWVIAQMELMQLPNAYDEWGGAFATELELGTLSILVATDGDVVIGDTVPCEDSTALPGVPLRTVESCTLVLFDEIPIVVINAPAVERAYGPPRPTSLSSTQHWMELYNVEPGDIVVAITVRVHGRRIVGDVERLIHSIDPTVTVIGFADGVKGDPREFFNHALGETVNQLVKAVEEYLNSMRPASARTIDLKQVRGYLDRLYQSPSHGTIRDILSEVLAV